jgi:hypothetical protein
MPGLPPRTDPDWDWEANDPAYQVRYLVKRPAYEFILAVPTDHPLFRSADSAFFQVRFKDRCQPHCLVLNRQELEDFYQSLGQLIEYIRIERARRHKVS